MTDAPPLFAHQAEVLAQSRDLPAFALFWEQGCGKTRTAIDTALHLYGKGEIKAVIVVAPNGVHLNWITDELPKHAPDAPILAHAWSSGKASTETHKRAVAELLAAKDRLAWMAIGYEAWMTLAGKRAVWALMKSRSTLLIADESHRIKTPAAKRTRSIIAGAKYAPYKRILTGTPMTNGPFDVYSQIRFLDPKFWDRRHIGSYSGFKQLFGEWAAHYIDEDTSFPKLQRYRNLEMLRDALKTISSRVVKDKVLDLPPKLYTRRYFDMTPAQRRIYNSLRDKASALTEDGELITTPLAIVKLLRLQQVLCGYVPADDADEPTQIIGPNDNPRLKLLTEVVEDAGGPTIIWAVYTMDVDLIMDALRKAGRKPVRYDGRVSDDDRYAARKAFMSGDATDFVANSAISEGLTLTRARTVIYYANSYRMGDRMQSEDRAHRIGQTSPVMYIDLVCPETQDGAIIDSLVAKRGVAEEVLK